MEKQNKSVKEALDSFDEYLYESTSGEIIKGYEKKKEQVDKANEILFNEAEKEKDTILSEYKKRLEEDEYSELLSQLDENLEFECDDMATTIDFGLSVQKTLKAINYLIPPIEETSDFSKFVYRKKPEDKNRVLFNKFAERSIEGEEKKERDYLVSNIEKLEKDNDKIEKSVRMKFLILALISFAIAIVFFVLGMTIIEAYMVFNTICGIAIIVGIVFLVLRSKVYERNKAIDINEKKIKSDKKRLNEINEAQKYKLAKKMNDLKFDELKKVQANCVKYEKDSGKLVNELKACGSEMKAKLEAKKNELMLGVSDICLTIFNKVEVMPVKFQNDFIDECRIRNVQSESEMLDVYKSLKRDYDEEISRKKREDDERLANEEMVRQAQEQNRILEDQARQARMAADEQNRLLKQQADAQKRQQEEAKRNGDNFRSTMCYKCKNYAGCGAKWNLTGPCPSFTQK